MIDIVFSESACGSLKVAQHYGKGKYQEGCIGIIISHADGSKPTKEEVETARQEAKKKARLAWESATPLGGKTTDIYGFNLVLSVGDISENQPGIKRKQTLEHLYSVYPNDEGRQAAEEMLKRANEDLKAIRERAAAGEALRIWYSNQPDEMCGLYWFMEQLNQWNVTKKEISCGKMAGVKWLPEDGISILPCKSLCCRYLNKAVHLTGRSFKGRTHLCGPS